MPRKPPSILFLCTGNSARSILAEAIANQKFGTKLQASSAGSKPKGQIHPLAIETLKKYGLSADELRSKGIDEFKGKPFDLVITLCDAAAQEQCPVFPGAANPVHWRMPDPPAAENPTAVFDAVYDVLFEAIGLIAEGPHFDPRDGAVEAGRHISRRFSPRAA